MSKYTSAQRTAMMWASVKRAQKAWGCSGSSSCSCNACGPWPPSPTLVSSGATHGSTSGTYTYNLVWGGSGSGSNSTDYADVPVSWDDGSLVLPLDATGAARLPEGMAIALAMPDGSTLHVDTDGNYHVDDRDAVVRYKACRIRNFNPHLNASDLLADFIRYVGSLGVRDIGKLPLHLFVNWLILEAAKQDADPVPADIQPIPKLLAPVAHPRCLCCKKYVQRRLASAGYSFCPGVCATRYGERLLSA